VVGLEDLTSSQSTILNAGMSYTATVKFGSCGNYYSGVGSAWIDFNGNGVFENLEVIGTWQGNTETQLDYNFTVPAGAQNGVTRMRVIQQEGATLPMNPCATFSWGSAVDFGIEIGNGIDCTGYEGDDESDAILVPSLPYTSTGDNSFCYANDNYVYASPDVYYRLNPTPLMQSITVSLCGSSFDTFLSVIDPSGNVIAFNDDADGCGTSSALTFDTDGLGQVYVIVEGWGNESGEFEIAINANYLDLNELNSSSFSLVPNPASSEISLTGYSGDIEIVNLSGQSVIKTNILSGQPIDVSNLSNGAYVVKLLNNSTLVVKKLMVNH
jgi:hypothetical protein